MSAQCQSCTAPTDVFLCGRCVSDLRATLDSLPQWIEWCTDAALGQTRLGSGGLRAKPEGLIKYTDPRPAADGISGTEGRRRFDRDLAAGKFARDTMLRQGGVNPRASQRLDDVRNSITTWVRHLAESRGIVFVRPTFIGPLLVGHVRQSTTTPALIEWLRASVQSIACDEAAGELVHDLTNHVRAIERIVNRPVPTIWLTCLTWNDGTRKECGNEMRCAEGTIEVTCQVCRTTHNVNRLQLSMWNEAERRELTVEDILKLNRRLPEDRRVNERTLRRWRQNGKLKPVGYNPADEPLYRWSDIRRLRVEPQKVQAS